MIPYLTPRHPSSCVLPVILAGAVVLAGLARGAERPRGISPDQYARGVVVSASDFGHNGFTLTVRNTNPPDTVPFSSCTMYAAVAVPPKSSVEFQLESRRWDYYPQNGPVEFDLAMGQESSRARFSATGTSPRAEYQDEFRSIGVARIVIPISHQPDPIVQAENHSSAQAVVREARYRVTFRGGRIAEEPYPGPGEIDFIDPFLRDFAPRLLANGEQAGMVSRAFIEHPEEARIDAWNARLARAAGTGRVILMRVTKPGLYVVAPADVASAGMNPGKLRIENLRTFLGDEEIPLVALNRDRGAFTGDSAVAFFVSDDRFDFEPWKPVWLFEDQGADGMPLRLHPARAQETGESREPKLRRKVSVFEPNKYSAQIGMETPMLRWVTAEIPRDDFAEYNLAASGLDSEPPADLELWFSGRQSNEIVQAEVFLNRESLGTRPFLGRESTSMKLPLDRGLLREGGNLLAVRYRADDLKTPGGVSIGSVLPFIKAELRYTSALRGLAPQELADIFFGPGETTSSLALDFGERAEGETLLIAHVRRDRAIAITESTAGVAGLAVSAQLDAAAPGDRIVAASRADLMHPQEIIAAQAPAVWISTAPCDLLTISWPGFIETLHPYAEYRRSRGLNVEVLPIDDIYNACSFGFKRYEAIRTAVRRVLAHREGARLRSVLLVGEASEYWWERKVPQDGSVQQDLVPVFGWGNPLVSVRGDDGYTRIMGTGAWADVMIGRLSVATTQQLESVIDRIIAYETQPSWGSWMSRVLLVADDEREFSDAANELAREALGPGLVPERLFQRDLPYDEFPRVPGRRRTIEGTRRLVEELSAGSLAVAFYGHGGPNVWTHERMLHLRDVAKIHHGAREPIICVASCDTAWIDFPTDPVTTSIGELLARSADCGAIAIWAPIAGTSSFEHRYLLGRFFTELTRHGDRLAGRAALYSKLGYLLDRQQEYVANQYVLLGDPELVLPSPDATMEIALSSEEIPAAGGATVDVRGRTPSIAWGAADVVLLDGDAKILAQQRRVRIEQGRFSAVITLPDTASPGVARVVVSAYNDASSALAVAEREVRLRPVRVELDWVGTERGSRVLRGRPGAERSATLVLTSNETLPLDKARIRLRDVDSGEIILDQHVTLAASSSAKVPVRLTMPDGVRHLAAELALRYDTWRERAPNVASAPLDIEGLPRDTQAILLAPSAARFTPDAAAGTTRLTMAFENVSDKVLPAMHARYSLQKPGGETIHESFEAFAALAPAGRRAIDMRAPAVLEPGAYSVQVELLRDENGTSATFELATAAITVPRGRNMRVVPESVRSEMDSNLLRSTVYVRGRIENIGDVTVDRYRVAMYNRHGPWVPENLLASPIMDESGIEGRPLASGESSDVRLRVDSLDINDPLDCPLYFTVEPLDGGTDIDKADNSELFTIHYTPRGNPAIASREARASASMVAPGDRVQFEVPIVNDSTADFPHEVPVTAYAESPNGPRRRLFLDVLPRLDPGAHATYQFNWRALAGENGVRVLIDEDQDFPEGSLVDNEMYFHFDPLVRAADLTDPLVRPSLAAIFRMGTSDGLVCVPDGTLAITARPVAHRLAFKIKPENIVGEPLPDMQHATLTDNRFALYETDEFITVSDRETFETVHMKFPVHDAGADLFDVTIQQRGSVASDTTASGEYKYRLGATGDWTDVRKGPGGAFPMGRTAAVDGAVHIEIASFGTPSQNEFYRVDIVPVRGSFTSPLFPAAEAGLMKFSGRSTVPDGARADFEIQFGDSEANAIEWLEWMPLTPGVALPVAPERADVFHWRVTLRAGPGGMPRVHDPGIELFEQPAEPVSWEPES